MTRRFLRRARYALQVAGHIFRGVDGAECSCCGYAGPFDAAGKPPRYGALCPSCGSLERHRLLALTDKANAFFAGRDVLHFAPEPVARKLIVAQAKRYVSADLIAGRADRIIDIEKMQEPDGSWDVIVCSHVLEHVDDRLALSEMHRVLRDAGLLIVMVPIIEGWSTTYENPMIRSGEEREKHFGQGDHVRYYGRDIRHRIESAGFAIESEVTAQGEDVLRYSLIRGEKVFLCRKAAG